jgi:hypothetical protein
MEFAVVWHSSAQSASIANIAGEASAPPRFIA